MIVDCYRCDALVDAAEKGEMPWPGDEGRDPARLVLLACPSCGDAILGFTELVQVTQNDWEWTRATRLWPDQQGQPFGEGIPSEVRMPLLEARKCFKVGAFSAVTVMSGKAVEAVCRDKTGLQKLFSGLEEMKKLGLIDEKIWRWADALRQERNLGAHATGHEPTKQDAEDILAFAVAIAEYVYVLSERFEEYMGRKNIGA